MNRANTKKRVVGTALVMLLSACGPSEVTANAQATTTAAMAPVAAGIAVGSSLPLTIAGPPVGPGSAIARAISCPAALSVGTPRRPGARLIGVPSGQAVALSSATVTADGVAAIKNDLSDLAEVEPEAGPARAGIVIQYQDAEPSKDAPCTLVCRYGRATGPMLAQAVLLVPLSPRLGRYRCTTELQQGRDPRRTRASCSVR